jgi:septal ring factor EnvC (AmiA/AmiB activator)
MLRALAAPLAVAALLALPAATALALTPEAEEWLAVTAKLEPVQCEKRRLRREIALAEAERRAADAQRLRARMAALNRDKDTARLEKRLAVLEAQLLDSQGRPRHAEDLDAISLQQRQAFYRCE